MSGGNSLFLRGIDDLEKAIQQVLYKNHSPNGYDMEKLVVDLTGDDNATSTAFMPILSAILMKMRSENRVDWIDSGAEPKTLYSKYRLSDEAYKQFKYVYAEDRSTDDVN